MYKQNKKMQAGTYLFDQTTSMPSTYTFKRMDVIADANEYGGFTALYYADHAGLINEIHASRPNGGTLVTPPLSNVKSNPGTLNGNLISGGAGDLWVFNLTGTVVFVVDVANETIKLWNCGLSWPGDFPAVPYTFTASGSGSGDGGASGDPFITPMIC